MAGRTENYGTGAYVPDWMSITYTGLAISFEIVCLAFWEYISAFNVVVDIIYLDLDEGYPWPSGDVSKYRSGRERDWSLQGLHFQEWTLPAQLCTQNHRSLSFL